MPDAETVKRTLSRLATDPTVSRVERSSDEYRTVIDSASAAAESLDAGVDFLETDGLDRLDVAIETAECAGDHAAVRRGEHARETLQRLLAAAREDHFHSGRGTHLGGGAEGMGK